MTFILNEDLIDYNLKKKINIYKIITIAIVLIISIILIKFKPAYAVTLGEEQIGYIGNRTEFQEEIDNNILNTNKENIAFVALDNVSYSFEFVDRSLINEEKVMDKVKENAQNIYFVYEVSSGNDENAVYVNSLEEAKSLVETLKQNYSEVEDDLKITTLYLENQISEEEIKEAKAKISQSLDAKLEEKKQRDKRTVNGIYLASLPLTGGTISSRYGSVEGVRDHVHGGLDLAASYGTPIKAVADGVVKTAGKTGGYGNLVVIDHGNGVETYYGHCSSINVTVGAEVSVNPQKYIY